jgi:hypothetical protein
MATNNRTSRGAFPAASLTELAANDERMGRAADTQTGGEDAEDRGWDPFEVWRTRVKEARERAATATSGSALKD